MPLFQLQLKEMLGPAATQRRWHKQTRRTNIQLAIIPPLQLLPSLLLVNDRVYLEILINQYCSEAEPAIQWALTY